MNKKIKLLILLLLTVLSCEIHAGVQYSSKDTVRGIYKKPKTTQSKTSTSTQGQQKEKQSTTSSTSTKNTKTTKTTTDSKSKTETVVKDTVKTSSNNGNLDQYKEGATELIQFFEYALNLLGDKETSSKDKDVIINQSFLKIFKNEKVQIEDDLDENRKTPINKDIQAYLKDVDYFFNGVSFELSVEDVSFAVNEKNETYLKMTLNRHLKGKTLTGDSVNTNRVRYVEMNINENTREIKIVSIYTSRINEKEEWRSWWNSLPVDWRLALGANVNLGDTKMSYIWELGSNYAIKSKDTVKISDDLIDNALSQIIYREDLDLNGSKVNDFSPLSKLTKLKRLNLSGTSISDIKSIRSMNNLAVLNLSNTKVSDLSALRYSLNLTNLNIQSTPVSDISVLSNLSNIEKLNCSNTNISSIKPLADIDNLVDVDCSNTQISSLDGLRGQSRLEVVNCSKTQVNNINLLKSLPKLERLEASNTAIDKLDSLSSSSNLQFIGIDNTKVKSLKPLEGLPAIGQVNCDNTPLDKENISSFLKAKPTALVIYESAMLVTWWQRLPDEWKQIFIKLNPSLSGTTSKELLHKLTGITDLKIVANDKISSLDPLKVFLSLKNLNLQYCKSVTSVQALSMLKGLTDLDISHTAVTDLAPLSELSQLESLNCSFTQILKLDGLSKLTKLSKVNLDNTGIVGLYPLSNSKNLQVVTANDSKLSVDSVVNFALANPTPLVIFRELELKNWWSKLSTPWKALFAKYCTLDINNPSSEQLHKLCSIESLTIDQSIKIGTSDLESLRKFYKLKELNIEDQNVTDLTPISKFKLLESLSAAKNPIKSASVLSNCTKLKMVDLENTPLENLNGFDALKQLTILKISGTKVSKLSNLKNSKSLATLECLNTTIYSVKDIKGIKSLKTLKIASNFWLKYFGGLNSFHSDCPKVDLIIY